MLLAFRTDGELYQACLPYLAVPLRAAQSTVLYGAVLVSVQLLVMVILI